MMNGKLHMPFTARQAVVYLTLPQFLPRLRDIGFKFAFVAYLMAGLYAWVGLIPRGHAFLNPAHIGTYSVRQVFIEAASHLTFRRSHIDQIIMFFVLLAAFILLIIQFMFLAAYLLIGVAHASGMPFVGVFNTPDPKNDIAMMLLDRVFGIPGFFGSCISRLDIVCDPTSAYITPAEPSSFPEPHQIAFQALFAYYSAGVMVLGMLIVAYFIVAVILESVQTGVPFGKRFASIYAPIRLCLAVLMLVPLPTPSASAGVVNGTLTGVIGYNAGQYLTLYLAKIGSGLGTNTWNVFNNFFIIGGKGVSAPPAGYGPLNPVPPSESGSAAATLIAAPVPSRIDPFLKYMFLVQSCRAMYDMAPSGDFGPRDASNKLIKDGSGNLIRFQVRPYIIMSDGFMPVIDGIGNVTSYKTALDFAKNRDITIRFGVEDPDKGTIAQKCGDIKLPVTALTGAGPTWLLEQNYNLIAQMWKEQGLITFGQRMAKMYISQSGGQQGVCNIIVPYPTSWGIKESDCGASNGWNDLPRAEYYTIFSTTYQVQIDDNLVVAHNKQVADTPPTIDDRILSRGWAGAGIWYNKIAAMNGSFFDAARSLPTIMRMPEPMEQVLKQRRAGVNGITVENRYTPLGGGEGALQGPDLDVAYGLNKVYLYFQDPTKFETTNLEGKTNNMIFDLMNKFFGTSALFDMRNNVDVNPMVQLTAMGKAITDQAFYNILVGMGIEFGTGTIAQLSTFDKMGEGLGKLGGVWFKVATLGLGVGILLYYVIPFLPFIYFFFSVIKWVQSIFEAMIGVPLWAIAHLRIDGDGIPPDAAEQGYHLLFEIMLRPAITIIAMVASFMIFTAMVFTLNDVFDLVMVNLTGYNPPSAGSSLADMELKRGTIDQFFYTVLYAILVYMIGMGSFKLIDQIPAEILRWMSSTAKNIIDESGDPTEGLIRGIYMQNFGMPVVQESGPLGKALSSMRETAKGLGKEAGKALGGKKEKGEADE